MDMDNVCARTEQDESNKQDTGSGSSADRQNNMDWSECGTCVGMLKPEENVCCHESNLISNLQGTAECITARISFPHVVLNIDTLNIARYAMMVHTKTDSERQEKANITNMVLRFAAYEQFVYWVNSWAPFGGGELFLRVLLKKLEWNIQN
ncbi:hypothetical protein PR048_010706 [Dryococelus australis]|uniref:P2X purinoreceptor 7 intracellular domain-containing protein n=1 Tax=Dryococelus australis TaxID=614101 RepID=A0ABQ9I3G4_9NEOP|nr:hypothetical protein PR048_010706 [Dryococelus australis]